ncbi:LmeA family phospholipid-binding protein [Litorihabitans aurantiacus]|uniref:DUF2993 domain-containing protein n=1 Tax=Litorihabitans aurantiacus TaxID=1930061 RepID=A0AA37XGZ8_9MICO|nr:DUF2993 domain-containing protein [Litorihabitans aurantiacus]GMA32779.1 hypothetical protein GCM10025875_27710 [Litorihabitans aurantiacus]
MSILDGAPAHQPRRRRRGRGVVALLVALLILAGLAVAADRIVVGQVEQQVATGLEDGLAATNVTAEVDGVPFLTQLVAGEITRVDITADSAVLEDIPFTDVDAVVGAIAFDLGTREIGRAGDLTASGTLATADLQNLLERELTDLDVTLATRDGAVVAATEVVGGLTLEARLTPRAADGSIAVDVETVTIADLEVSVDDLPNALAQRLTDLRVDVPGLPDGLGITNLDVIDAGVRVTVAGTDVDLTGVS